MKNNYCEVCKFQFKDRSAFMLHIQAVHSEGQPRVKTQDLGHPNRIEIMSEEKVLEYYLKSSETIRNKYGIGKDSATSRLFVRDEGLLEKQDATIVSQIRRILR